MAIALRGTNQVASVGTSYVVPLPAGSAAGDTAIIFAGGGFAANTPAGWSVIDNQTGSNTNGAVFRKELDAADITATSITVTTTGSFSAAVAIVVFQGTIGSVRTFASQRNATAANRTVTTNSLPKTGNYAIYWGACRRSSAPTAAGSAGTALQNNVTTNVAADLRGELLASDGALSSTFTYTGGTTTPGDYEIILVLTETAENRLEVGQVVYEVLTFYNPPLRVGQVAYEVLRTIASGVAPPVRRRPLVLGGT